MRERTPDLSAADESDLRAGHADLLNMDARRR
jgi:hypothetical protein